MARDWIYIFVQKEQTMTSTTNGFDNTSKAPATRELAGTTAAASGTLSQEAFGDPRTFLKTLSSDLYKIEPEAVIGVSKQELLDFAANPANTSSEKAAANIAANHYDELSGMSHLPLEDDGLYNNSANTILNLSKGDSGWTIANAELAYGSGLLAGSVLAGIGGLVAAGTPEIPPIAIAGGAIAVAGGSFAAFSAREMWNAPSTINALGKQDKATLSTWKEINSQVS
jgi:hypothetical protein